MITITLDMIFQALTDITAGNEDFVYEPPTDPETGMSQDTCVYLDPYANCPSCGVGQALSRLGVPNEVLSDLDDSGSIDVPGSQETLKAAGFEMTESAVWVASAFQSIQDNDRPWSEALARATKVMEETP